MNELKLDYTAGQTVTARVRNAAGQAFHIAGGAFETYGAGGHAAGSYDVAMTDSGNGAYRGTFPAAVTALAANADYYVQFWDSTITTSAVGRQEIFVRNGSVYGLADVIGLHGAGPGDYLVTLTIRTTAGAPLPGTRVWLSTDGDRENPVSGAKVTNDAGVVTFYCDYTTYYIHCHLVGHTFAAASFTAAAGSVAFTKDIGTAVTASGSASDYATAFLIRMIGQVRKWANEPTINVLYSDDWIIERAENVYALVLGEKQRQESDPIVATIEISVASGTNDYVLPDCFGPVQAVYYNVGHGCKVFYHRGSSYNMKGKGVWVEGNLLRLQDSAIAYGETITVEAQPNGLARLHAGTCTLNAAGTLATLGATPYKGTLDLQVNAYLGSILRIIKVTGTSPTGNYIQQRKITAYNVETRAATLAAALNPVPAAGAGGYIFYEIAPQIPIGLDAIIAPRIAWEMLNSQGVTKKAQGCLAVYTQNLRHLRLSAFVSQLQRAGLTDADTIQNAAFEGNAL
ncbi:MAG: hypothetical protein V2A79_09740 [Planctomycetota bacterium]